MKERPILFSAPMVRALLEGRKTMTRRVVKPHRLWKCHSICAPEKAADSWAVWFHYPETDRVGHLVDCPYGKPGDRLWVRETWACNPYDDRLWYRASESLPDSAEYGPLGWRPSIFMPRAFSRITLEITDVRVQRLQEISEDDALAEGVEADRRGWKDYFGGESCLGFASTSFASLWDSINARRGFGWDANPWAWALSFRRIEAAERAA
jgi:hypothetical protein